MTDIVLILTTLPVDVATDAFANQLVEAGHAACVSIGAPVTSTYRWQGRVESAAECPVTIKTTQRRVADLQAALTAAHPYDVPEFLVISVAGGSDAYLAWLRGAVARPDDAVTAI